MGNYRFRLSDMMPNSWFYKLRDNMSKPVNKTHNHKIKKQLHAQSSSSSLSSSAPQPPNSQITKLPHLSDQRKSYYFTREITFHPAAPISPTKTTTTRPAPDSDPPRKSSRRPRSSGRRTRTRQPKPPSEQPAISSSSGDSGSDVDDAACTKCQTGNDVVDVINGLPPIITKKPAAESGKPAPPPPSTSTSPGVKLRTNTPKIANRRISQGRKSASGAGGGGGGRRSMSSESFAVVKKSRDPGRDFRESMVEMIVENNIRASKDLEELLACYLSLNADEYHELIINVFKQIWFDFVRFRLKS